MTLATASITEPAPRDAYRHLSGAPSGTRLERIQTAAVGATMLEASMSFWRVLCGPGPSEGRPERSTGHTVKRP
jgi:hypothetical protein